MPHNLYLHSAVIQTRDYPRTHKGRAEAILWGSIDSTLALGAAFLVNAAILILAAAAFYYSADPHRRVVLVCRAETRCARAGPTAHGLHARGAA